MNTINRQSMNRHYSLPNLSHSVSLTFRVIVLTTPGIDVSTVVMANLDDATVVQGNCYSSGRFSLPPLNFELLAEEGFDIDWCQYVVRMVVFEHVYLSSLYSLTIMLTATLSLITLVP